MGAEDRWFESGYPDMDKEFRTTFWMYTSPTPGAFKQIYDQRHRVDHWEWTPTPEVIRVECDADSVIINQWSYLNVPGPDGITADEYQTTMAVGKDMYSIPFVWFYWSVGR